jgi:signal transduction histidine kinase
VSEYLKDFEITLRIDAEENLREVELGTELRHDAFLCIREALTNVIRHANASMVTLRIYEFENKIKVKISDNGCGFKPENVNDFSNGLKNMCSRFQKYGGKVEITSEIGLGTSVLLEIPT